MDGIYSFSFHALTQDGSATYVKLTHQYVNGTERAVAGAYRRHEKEGDEMSKTPVSHSFKEMFFQNIVHIFKRLILLYTDYETIKEF